MEHVPQPADDGQERAPRRRPRSRIRRRLAQRAPIDTTNPAAVVAWAGTVRPVVASLRALAEEATDRPAMRAHSRVFLRTAMLKSLRELEARLDAVAPPQGATSPAPAD